MKTASLNAAPDTPETELAHRIKRLRAAMAQADVSAIIITSYANFEYLAGHLYSAWDLQSRPVFAILGLEDFVVVASPSSERLISLRTRPFRPAFYKGFQAEGAQKAIEVIEQFNLKQQATVAIDYGQDIYARGVLDLIDGLRSRRSQYNVVSGEKLVWQVRNIKSEYEADLKRNALAITNAAFDQTVAVAKAGMTELEFFRQMKCNLVQNGAERVDPMIVKFGKGDFIYDQLPGDRRLKAGDYIWGDFYATYCGYPADRCRIARCGQPGLEETKTYKAVRGVTVDLCQSIRPGMTGADIYRRFEELWADTGLDPIWSAASRIGHSSGLEVTEITSIANWSHDVIEAGMILHLEPKFEKYGGVFQFEEVIYVRQDGVDFLSDLSPEELPVISEG